MPSTHLEGVVDSGLKSYNGAAGTLRASVSAISHTVSAHALRVCSEDSKGGRQEAVPDLTGCHAEVPVANWISDIQDARTNHNDTSASVEMFMEELGAARLTRETQLQEKLREAAQLTEKVALECLVVQAIDDSIAKIRQCRIRALEDVQGLTAKQCSEVKALKSRPPKQVRRAFEAVFLVLNAKTWSRSLDTQKEWSKIQRMLSNNSFLDAVLMFDVAVLDAAPHVADCVTERYFPKSGLQDLSNVFPEGCAPPPPIASSRPVFSCGSQCGDSHVHAASLKSGRRPAQGSGGGAKAASIAAARLLKSGGKDQAGTEATEQLDVEAVHYASRACGCLVHWCLEVLREFYGLRRFRAARAEANARLSDANAALLDTEAGCARLRTELEAVASEVAGWRQRLEDVRQREREVQSAKNSLAKLERLEAGGPGPACRPPAAAGELAAAAPLVLRRSSGRGLLLSSGDPCGGSGRHASGVSPFRGDKGSLSMADLQALGRKPDSDESEAKALLSSNVYNAAARKGARAARPCAPATRKYLHVMSTPALHSDEG